MGASHVHLVATELLATETALSRIQRDLVEVATRNYDVAVGLNRPPAAFDRPRIICGCPQGPLGVRRQHGCHRERSESERRDAALKVVPGTLRAPRKYSEDTEGINEANQQR